MYTSFFLRCAHAWMGWVQGWILHMGHGDAKHTWTCCCLLTNRQLELKLRCCRQTDLGPSGARCCLTTCTHSMPPVPSDLALQHGNGPDMRILVVCLGLGKHTCANKHTLTTCNSTCTRRQRLQGGACRLMHTAGGTPRSDSKLRACLGACRKHGDNGAHRSVQTQPRLHQQHDAVHHPHNPCCTRIACCNPHPRLAAPQPA